MNSGAFAVNGLKGKAPANRTHSAGFARSNTPEPARQRLECAGFSGALGRGKLQWLLAMVFTGLLCQPGPVWACAACYGQSDSPLAKGMNWGIFSLLAVVVFVLGSITSFFVYLGKRGGKTPTGAAPAPSAESTPKDRT
jgi:hypothetical protein